MRKIVLLSFCQAIVFALAMKGQEKASLRIQTAHPIARIPSTMWGIFFEDINFAADGGLYAEMVKNRSFEFPMPLMGWEEKKAKYQNGKILIINNAAASGGNRRYARMRIQAAKGEYILSNEGFRGMGFRQQESYNFSMIAKTDQPSSLRIYIQLVSQSGHILAEQSISSFTGNWEKHTASLTCSDSSMKGYLNLVFVGNGTIDIDMVSLFPHNTWKQRTNGLRADLVQLLADLKPGFIRFPGGCIVEGRDLTNRYQWKKTVGPPEERGLIMNRWNVEFAHRNAPDYFQSYGLGFFEYFQLAEDLGAEPLPILNCGMACQFNSGEIASVEDLGPYIQDALDLVEFANGPVSSTWGKLRAEMGHPKPFNLTFLGIGNEQWESQYIERYRIFEKAIRSVYPGIQLVSGAGPYSNGLYFDYAWKELRQLHPALVDEHYYKDPTWFLANAGRYDGYKREGPRVFAGEYAAHTNEVAAPEGRNNWESALAEAAFMTGLERNADLVQMASYAPLLAHVDAWQWRPDLIWYDNLRAVATPNYYVQKLFSVNKGTDVLEAFMNQEPLKGQDSLYASAVLDKNAGTIIIKLVNAGLVTKTIPIRIDGIGSSSGPVTITELYGNQPSDFNSFDRPGQLQPVTKTIVTRKNAFDATLRPASLTVFSIPFRNAKTGK